ncbi:MAG: hypothetical protein ACQEQO_10615 [Thermodesulfobacteriota bacterium]
MDLLEEIRAQHQPKIEDVEEIKIETGPVAFTSAGITDPKIGVEGKFSLRFLAALSLAEGNVTLDKFTDEKVNDPRLIQLRKKVRAALVRELNFGARVAVRMKDGTIYRGSLEAPKGDPANPMSSDEIEEKFRNTARLAIPKKNMELVIELIKNFERLSGIEEIIALL